MQGRKWTMAINKARNMYNLFCKPCKEKFWNNIKPQGDPTLARQETLALLCDDCKKKYNEMK